MNIKPQTLTSDMNPKYAIRKRGTTFSNLPLFAHYANKSKTNITLRTQISTYILAKKKERISTHIILERYIFQK